MVEQTVETETKETMNASKSVLLLVDVQNIYYSARSLYGERARIDFRKLKRVSMGMEEAGLIRSVAFIAHNKFDDTSFLNFLRKAGYDVVGFDKTASEAIKEFAEEEGGRFDEIAVCSGSGDLLPLYEKLSQGESKPHVRVIAFPDSLQKNVPEVVSEVILLDSSILLNF